MSGLREPLQLPLEGIRVVEASAGTGKTFTIATLYLRLILECGRLPEEIVVATFTRAATAELSQRLRARLACADDLLGRDDPAASEAGASEAGEDGEAAVVRATIRQALAQGRSLDELRRHARKARLAMDSAMIGTLHGFCFRALADFGFETRQALDEPELIDDLRALELEIVRDFWRRGSADASIARLLADTWGSPGTLARQLCDARWRGRAIEVPAVDLGALESALAPIRGRIATWDDTVLDRCDQEIGASFNHHSARKARCRALRALRDWARGGLADADPDACALAEVKRFERAEMEGLGSFVRHPDGQAFDAVRALHPLLTALVAGRSAMSGFRAAELLRDARAYLDRERPRRLAARNLMGHDQAVDRLEAALADPARGDAAVAKMRARWKAALIDEFQDTDAAQWHVVRRLFGDTTLVLVGDPKQSIYGFRGGDVYAWREAVAVSERHARLELATSYRSGSGMTGAVNALFDRPGAFIEEGFDYPEVASDASVAARALLREGKILPALQLWRFTPADVGQPDGKPASKERARAGIEAACVAWIAQQLEDPAVELQERDGKRSRLRPKNIAVLVNSNAEAHSMQAALGRAGIAASSNLRASVYASDEAADLVLLLDALAAPDDIRRARAAHASVLLGHDVSALAAANLDPPAQAAMLEHVAEWVSSVDRRGPLPWLHARVAEAAPRILVWPDGERRVSNYLQLAELLQDLHATSFGIGDLASRFSRARVEAGDDPDNARLRIDTDADAVTIATVHAAKGLEYDVVLVPYAVLAFDPGKHSEQVPLYWHHVGNEARVAIGQGTEPAIMARAQMETRAEEIRKFYVAVTRAKALCALPWGETTCARYSAAYHLLHEAGRAEPLPADSAGCDAAMRELCERAGTAAEVVALPRRAKPRLPHRHDEQPQALTAREFARKTLQRDWRTWSFSRLVRGQTAANDSDPAPGTGDGDVLAAEAARSRATLAGPRFGTAVHAALEHADYAVWSGGTEIPESQRALITRCLRAQGLPDSGMRIDEAVRQTGACVGAALNAALPCGIPVRNLAPTARRAEMEFHLALAPAAAAQWFALLHRHGYQRQRRGVGVDDLHGLLTGVIDLVFEHDGRFHIIDWKTNWCPPYDSRALGVEIATHDYDLQWLIYTLALHRWLRQRIADYDYDRHVGEVYYLFVRGLADGRGIHVDRPPRGLIEAMDVLFDARAEAIA